MGHLPGWVALDPWARVPRRPARGFVRIPHPDCATHPPNTVMSLESSWRRTDALKRLVQRVAEKALLKWDTRDLVRDLEKARPRVNALWCKLECRIAQVESPRHRRLLRNVVRLGCWTWNHDLAYRDVLDAAVWDILEAARELLELPERRLAPDSWHINGVEESRRWRQMLDEAAASGANR